MSTLLSKVAMSATVRDYAQGAARQYIGDVAEFIAPTVNVPGSLFRYWAYTDGNQFKVPNTKRSVLGRAAVAQLSGTEITAMLEPNALDYPLDEFQMAQEEEGLVMTLQEGSEFIGQLAGLAHEKEVVDMAVAASGAGTDLAADTSGMNFIKEINTRIISVAKAAKTGSLMKIRTLWGPTALNIVSSHSSTKANFGGNSKKTGADIGLEDIGNLLMGKPESKLALTVADTAGQGEAAADEFLLDDSILIFASMATPTRADASFMKTFRLRNKFMVPGTYARDDGRVNVAKYDWYCLPKVTNSAVIIRLNIKESA